MEATYTIALHVQFLHKYLLLVFSKKIVLNKLMDPFELISFTGMLFQNSLILFPMKIQRANIFN